MRIQNVFESRNRSRGLKLGLLQIWGAPVGVDQPQERVAAYVDHYTNLIRVNASLATTLNLVYTPQTTIELVNLVKKEATKTIGEICTSIVGASLKWNQSGLDDEGARKALSFALRLWLFSDPSISQSDRTITDANCILHRTNALPPVNSSADHIRSLSTDFSARSLTRKAGFFLVWTSDITEHLKFVSKNQLRVFRHAQILRNYQYGPERDLYPTGFLEETYRTVNLLFPFEEIHTSKRVRRITRKHQVDIEAPMDAEKAMEDYNHYQICTYQYYGPRLAEIQRRYDIARPHRLQQWWYDRRQRQEWGALMVALIVFVLTMFFGLIQSITGIMQVWAAFRM